MDYDNLDLQDMGTEKQVLMGWREEKVRVALLGNETAEGRIRAIHIVVNPEKLQNIPQMS